MMTASATIFVMTGIGGNHISLDTGDFCIGHDIIDDISHDISGYDTVDDTSNGTSPTI
jgi:hypothetical protein